MTIRKGLVVPGTLKKANEGVNDSHVCSVILDGEIVRAYVKPIEREKIIVECFCALLLKQWGLEVPEPIVVEIDGKEWFGSVEDVYPSLSRRFFLHDKDVPEFERRAHAAIVVAMNLPDTPLALACDEAIANGDRNLGNILWDGERTAWIDHEDAIIDKDDGSSKANKLAIMACKMNDHEAKGIQWQAAKSARKIMGSLDDIDAIASNVEGAEDCATIVKHHMSNVLNHVIDRFPKPEDDLFGS